MLPNYQILFKKSNIQLKLDYQNYDINYQKLRSVEMSPSILYDLDSWFLLLIDKDDLPGKQTNDL